MHVACIPRCLLLNAVAVLRSPRALLSVSASSSRCQFSFYPPAFAGVSMDLAQILGPWRSPSPATVLLSRDFGGSMEEVLAERSCRWHFGIFGKFLHSLPGLALHDLYLLSYPVWRLGFPWIVMLSKGSQSLAHPPIILPHRIRWRNGWLFQYDDAEVAVAVYRPRKATLAHPWGYQ